MATNNENKSAGALALEECAAAYADMTAQFVEIGFGDCQVDWRAPLAKVAIFKAAMDAEAAAETEEATKNYAYVQEGEDLKPSQAKGKADDFNVATEGKKKLLWEYYPKVLEEKYPEDAAAFKAAEKAAKDAEAGAGASTGKTGD